MVNQSKVNDLRFWKKWRDSGAVGTIEDAVLRTMQRDREQRSVCVAVNQSAGFYGDTTFNQKSGKYESNTDGRPKLYSYGINRKPLFGADIPYAFQIKSVPGVGMVVYRQGGHSTHYHTQEGPKQENPNLANVAGVLVSDKQETNKYGDKSVTVALFDARKDSELVEKTKAFLRDQGVSGYIAFQT